MILRLIPVDHLKQVNVHEFHLRNKVLLQSSCLSILKWWIEVWQVQTRRTGKITIFSEIAQKGEIWNHDDRWEIQLAAINKIIVSTQSKNIEPIFFRGTSRCNLIFLSTAIDSTINDHLFPKIPIATLFGNGSIVLENLATAILLGG